MLLEFPDLVLELPDHGFPLGREGLSLLLDLDFELVEFFVAVADFLDVGDFWPRFFEGIIICRFVLF